MFWGRQETLDLQRRFSSALGPRRIGRCTYCWWCSQGINHITAHVRRALIGADVYEWIPCAVHQHTTHEEREANLAELIEKGIQ